MLINYYFVRPVHTLDVAQGEQVLALLVFLIVAAIVSGAVELAARRGAGGGARGAAGRDALGARGRRARARASRCTAILERARNTFHMESVALKARDGRRLDESSTRSGWAPPGEEAPLRFDVPMGPRLRLVGRGPALFAQDQRVLQAFAAAAQTAYEGRRLSARAEKARELATADHQRTALLAAVGHDLRTPLAAIKASASTLRQTDVDWSAEERAELLATIEESADRLDVDRRRTCSTPAGFRRARSSVQARPVALDEVIGAAVLAVPGAAERVTLDVPEDLPLVQADPGLLERVLANLLENAVRHGAPRPADRGQRRRGRRDGDAQGRRSRARRAGGPPRGDVPALPARRRPGRRARGRARPERGARVHGGDGRAADRRLVIGQRAHDATAAPAGAR